jgi:hypothetical protein
MEINEQPTIFKFSVDDDMRANLKNIALWARINAIIAFISFGISLVTIIIAGSKFLDAYDTGKLIGKQIIMWVVSLVVNIILYTASNNIQKALSNTDQRLFNLGIDQLARYFKIIGILFIVAIVLCLLVLVVFVVAAGMH